VSRSLDRLGAVAWALRQQLRPEHKLTLVGVANGGRGTSTAIAEFCCISESFAVEILLELEHDGFISADVDGYFDINYTPPAHPEPASAARPGRLYAFAASDRSLVKVGFTTGDVVKRMRAIEGSAGTDLHVIGSRPGTTADEARVHAALTDHLHRGEWYQDDQSLRDRLTREGFE
jgi:hypothetical protein